MVIIKISIEKFDLELNSPFSYFTAALHCLPYAIVSIETNTGLIGFGEVAAAWDITGETQEGAIGLKKYIKQILLEKPLNEVSDVVEIMKNINGNIYGNSALKAGIEMALLDLLGKFKKQPVYKLFNDKPKQDIIPQKVCSFEEAHSPQLKKEIQQAIINGTKIFKFKIGQGKGKDLFLVKEISKISPKIKIVLDVNQGWENADYAISIIKELEKFNIAWIEQPLPYCNYEGLNQIRKSTKIPIMVDESCHTLLDLQNLYRNDALDMVNIKLAKCGGILEMIKMINFCEKNEIRYMLGDMISSSLGTAANLHAAMLGNFISFDVTFPNRIKNDLFFGLKFDKAKAFIPQSIGLGVKKIKK